MCGSVASTPGRRHRRPIAYGKTGRHRANTPVAPVMFLGGLFVRRLKTDLHRAAQAPGLVLTLTWTSGHLPFFHGNRETKQCSQSSELDCSMLQHNIDVATVLEAVVGAALSGVATTAAQLGNAARSGARRIMPRIGKSGSRDVRAKPNRQT